MLSTNMSIHKVKVGLLVLIGGVVALNFYFLLYQTECLRSCSSKPSPLKHSGAICTTSPFKFRGSCVEENGTLNCKCPICSSVHEPVCGSNDVTYQNECLLRLEACKSNSNIQVLHLGLCRYKQECSLLMDKIDDLNSKCSKCSCKFVENIKDEGQNDIWGPTYRPDEQDHPLVTNYLVQNHIFSIPERRNPLIPYPEGDDSDMKKFITPLFKKFKSGFFVESGANDGVHLSNTLALERDQNWTGLLIEPNPLVWPKILLSNRKTWLANVGLSRYSYPEKVDFSLRTGDKKWFQEMGVKYRENDSDRLKKLPNNNRDYVSLGKIPCFTLYSILKAIQVGKVDFLSLHIGGLELEVLRNYPFDRLSIKVIHVQVDLIAEGVGQLEDLLISNGYLRIHTLKVSRIYGHLNYLDELEYDMNKYT